MPQQAQTNSVNRAGDPAVGNIGGQTTVVPAFGKRNTQKPIKAIIGIVILLVLSFVFYEFRDKSRDHQTAPANTQSTTAPKR